jgi:hypothetical protein
MPRYLALNGLFELCPPITPAELRTAVAITFQDILEIKVFRIDACDRRIDGCKLCNIAMIAVINDVRMLSMIVDYLAERGLILRTVELGVVFDGEEAARIAGVDEVIDDGGNNHN